MAEGVDYSFDKPSPAALRAAGKTFACTYVSNGPSGKNMTRAEVRALHAHGISVVTCYQTTRGFMISTAAAGRAAARAGWAMAAACGMPRDRPIYFALDTDPSVLSSADWRRVRAFCNGAAAVLGRHRVGVYGGLDAIERLVPGSAPWGWQTRAWSVRGGRVVWSRKAHILQYNLGPSGLGIRAYGGTVDLNRSTRSDFGQWPEEDLLPALTDAEQRELLRRLRTISEDISGDGRLRETVFASRALVGSEPDEQIDNARAASREARANLKTLVQGAVLDGLRPRTDEDPDRGVLRDTFKEVIREVLEEQGVTG